MKNKLLFLLLPWLVVIFPSTAESQKVEVEIRPPKVTTWNPLHHTHCGCRVVKNWVFPSTQAATQVWKRYVDCEWQAHPELQESDDADVRPTHFQVVENPSEGEINPFFEEWYVEDSPETPSSNAKSSGISPFEKKGSSIYWKFSDQSTSYHVATPLYHQVAEGLASVTRHIASSPFLPGSFQKVQAQRRISELDEFKSVMDHNRETVSKINVQMEKDVLAFISQTSILLDHSFNVHLPPLQEAMTRLEEKINKSAAQNANLEKFIERESVPISLERIELELADPWQETQMAQIQMLRESLNTLISQRKFEEALSSITQIQDELDGFLELKNLPSHISSTLSKKQELLEEVVSAQGIIRFLPLPSAISSLNPLVSDPNSVLGKKIRREMNRGLVSWHTHTGAEDQAQLLAAFAFLKAADTAEASQDTVSSFENLKMASTLIDVVLGLIPVVSTVHDISTVFHGILTGYDLFGHPMASADYALRGFSAVAGLVGAGQLVKLAKYPITKSLTVGASLIRKFKAGETLANATTHLATKVKIVNDLGEFAASTSVRNGTIREGMDALHKMTPPQFESVIDKSARVIDGMTSGSKETELFRLVPTGNPAQIDRAKAIVKEQTFLTESFLARSDDAFKDNRFGKAVGFTQNAQTAVKEVFLDEAPDWIREKSYVLLKTSMKTEDISKVIVAPSAAVLGEISVHIKPGPTSFWQIQAIEGHADIIKELGL